MEDKYAEFSRAWVANGTVDPTEENVAKWCEMSDEFSLDICAQVGRVGRIPGAENTQGPYADVPCVVSAEDGRIKRKTSVDLDMLPDEDETEAQE